MIHALHSKHHTGTYMSNISPKSRSKPPSFSSSVGSARRVVVLMMVTANSRPTERGVDGAKASTPEKRSAMAASTSFMFSRLILCGSLVCTIHRPSVHYPPPGKSCSCVAYVTCLRPSAFASRSAFESNFLFLLSSFSFSRRSFHFCLHDLSKIPTNFWRGSLLPLTTYFFVSIFCLHIAPYFLHFATAYLRNCAQNIADLSIRNYAIDATRPTVPTI